MARVPTIRARGIRTQFAPVPINPARIETAYTDIARAAMAIDDATKPLRARAGREAGERAVSRDENGEIVVEKPGFLGFVDPTYAEARANAAEASYLAKSETDIREELADLRDKFPLDAAKFNEAAEEVTARFRDEAPGQFSGNIFRLATAEAQRQSRGIQATADRVERREQRESLLAQADSLREDLIAMAAQGGTETEDFVETSAKLDGVLTSLRANPLLGFTERDEQAFREDTRRKAQRQAIARAGLATFERTGSVPEAVQEVERAVDQAGLNELDAQAALDFAVAKVIDRGRIQELATADQRATLERARATAQSDLEIAISRGEAGEEEIEKAFENQIISPSERSRLIIRADKVHEKQIGERAALARVSGALTGRTLLNPRDKDDRDAVDAFWDRALETELSEAGPGLQDNAMVRLASRTGIIPETERGRVAGALMAGSVEDKVRAADTLDRLGDANPILLDQFSSRERQVGQMIASFMKAGMEPALSVEAAEKAVFEAKDPERKARREEVQNEDYLNKNDRWLRRELDNLSLSLGEVIEGALLFEARVPEVTPSALADFNLLFQNHYQATGDLNAARKLAFKDFRRTWGVTKIGAGTAGGGRTMKYAPELVYQDQSGWVEEQFREEIKELDLKPRDVLLVSDHRTAREIDGTPSYGLLRRDEDGRLVPITNEAGVNLRFRPDVATSPAGRRQRERAEDAFSEAQEARAAKAEVQRLRLRMRPDPAREDIAIAEAGGT